MKTMTIMAAGLALAGTLAAAPACAQNKRSFVSGQGNDANPFQLAAPCRSFQRAHDVTNAGGEISILDVAGYGLVTITKAISIVNDGVGEAGITFNSSSPYEGIIIQAGANDAVHLRGLTIEGAGIGSSGIHFSSGKSLTIENCVIRHFTNDAIDFFPSGSTALSVSNSLVADNATYGIYIDPTGSGAVSAMLDHVQINGNGRHGLIAYGGDSSGTITATVSDSVASGNGGFGFYAFTASAQTSLALFNSVAANNDTGLGANGLGAILRVAHSMVSGNANGWRALSSGAVLSDGDNTIEGNTANEAAPPIYTRK